SGSKPPILVRQSPPPCGWREGDVRRIPTLLLIAAATLLAACGPPKPPLPVPQLSGSERYLVDPRIGAPAPPPNLDATFDLAWRFVVMDDRIEATKALLAVVKKNPGYVPAQLAPAVF